MSTTFAGIDVSKGSFHFNILHNGKEKKKVFLNKDKGFLDLFKFLEHCHISQIHACMEATGTHHEALAEAFVKNGHLVSVIAPDQSAAFIESLKWRNKTDELDAKALRLFGEQRNPPLWIPPSESFKKLRRLVRRIDALVEIQTQEKNRLQEPGLSDEERASLQRSLDFLANEIVCLKNELDELIKKDPPLQKQRDLLDSIPGIAPWSAARILAEIPDIQTFKNAKQLVAYAGLAPQKKESGTSVKKKEKLCKIGSARLRDALFMPVFACLSKQTFLLEMALRLRARPGKEHHRVKGACMRKLLHIIFGVLKHGKPFDPALASA